MPTASRPLDARGRAYVPATRARVVETSTTALCGTSGSWAEGQQACKGLTGGSSRCLRVFRRSDVGFTLRVDNEQQGLYTTVGRQGQSKVYAACARLQAGRYKVTIDGSTYSIQDSQPPDNCG